MMFPYIPVEIGAGVIAAGTSYAYPWVLLSSGEVVGGFTMLANRGQYGSIRNYIYEYLSLQEDSYFLWIPIKGSDATHKKLLDAFDKLDKLRRLVRCKNPYVNGCLKSDIESGLHHYYKTLWHHCQSISIVKRNGVGMVRMKSGLDEMQQSLARISKNAYDATSVLSNMTLLNHQQEIPTETADEYFARFSASAESELSVRAKSVAELRRRK